MTLEKASFYSRTGKRLFDLFVAVCLLVVLSPILAVSGFFVRTRLGAPVLFRQERPGLRGQPFQIVKFRTMTNERDKNGNLMPDAVRLTPFGKFLRSTSLDELPELLNILKGEMSLIGPRPLLVEYLSQYSSEQARRHEVRPGLTGWAQINGRNSVSWEDRFRMDVWYVDNVSFWLDLKILFLTIWKTIRRDGINAPGEATMAVFRSGDNGHGGRHEDQR